MTIKKMLPALERMQRQVGEFLRQAYEEQERVDKLTNRLDPIKERLLVGQGKLSSDAMVLLYPPSVGSEHDYSDESVVGALDELRRGLTNLTKKKGLLEDYLKIVDRFDATAERLAKSPKNAR